MDYWIAKPHAEQKYHILGKYLAACGAFARKYRNFAYIDTHGGSGLVQMEEDSPLFIGNTQQAQGSPLVAARAIQAWGGGKEFPCHVIEIHPGRYATLKQSTAAFPWVHTRQGDCNVLLPQIFGSIPSWAFALCFIDPDGLVYDGPGVKGQVLQFTWGTMERIAANKKVEVLLNFPLEAILRCSAHCQSLPDNPKSQTMASHLTKYFGSEDWWTLCRKREFLDLYLYRLRSLGFPYLGAYYVCHGNLSLYYLIYASRKDIGAKIMRDIMRIEWRTTHPRWANEAAQAKVEHPLEEFIFDEEGCFVSQYPSNWAAIAQTVKNAAEWKCQECGHPHDPGNHYVLTVHHRDGNRCNNDPANLVALCQRCHLRAQGQLLRFGVQKPPAEARQPSLFPEGES